MKSIILFVSLTILIASASEESESYNKFVPTNEWQVVKKGQPIPKGLHVRVNFETGITEAKLLEPESDKNKALSIVDDSTEHNDETKVDFDELKHAMHKIKSDDRTPTEDEEISNKFKSYEDISKAFKEINMNIKMDSEIIAEKIELLKELMKDKGADNMNKKTADIILILADLDFFIHQIDNAYEFVRLRGIQDVIIPNITNQTNVNIQSLVLEMLGSLTQNNKKTQIAALEANIDNHLLNILNSGSNEIKKKAIFALGALTRGFPIAQKQIITKADGNVLLSIVDDNKFTDLKLKTKVVTLINDYLSEYYTTKNNEPKKLELYEEVNLENILKELGYCNALVKLFVENNDSVETTHYDNHEKLLQAIEVSKHLCSEEYIKNKRYSEILNDLKSVFHELSLSEMIQENTDSNTGYYQGLLELVELLQFPQIQKKEEL